MQCDADLVDSALVVEPFPRCGIFLEDTVDGQVLCSCEEKSEESTSKDEPEHEVVAFFEANGVVYVSHEAHKGIGVGVVSMECHVESGVVCESDSSVGSREEVLVRCIPTRVYSTIYISMLSSRHVETPFVDGRTNSALPDANGEHDYPAAFHERENVGSLEVSSHKAAR